MEKILRLHEVAEMFSLSKISITRMVKAGRFPEPVQIGERAIGWLLTDLEAHITSLKEK
jgi:prophage regulatory protein